MALSNSHGEASSQGILGDRFWRAPKTKSTAPLYYEVKLTDVNADFWIVTAGSQGSGRATRSCWGTMFLQAGMFGFTTMCPFRQEIGKRAVFASLRECNVLLGETHANMIMPVTLAVHKIAKHIKFQPEKKKNTREPMRDRGMPTVKPWQTSLHRYYIIPSLLNVC